MSPAFLGSSSAATIPKKVKRAVNVRLFQRKNLSDLSMNIDRSVNLQVDHPGVGSQLRNELRRIHVAHRNRHLIARARRNDEVPVSIAESMHVVAVDRL